MRGYDDPRWDPEDEAGEDGLAEELGYLHLHLETEEDFGYEDD